MPIYQDSRHPNVQHGAFNANTPEYEAQPLIAIGPLLAILWARKGLITLVTAIFVSLALLYVFITPSTYTAKGVIVIDPRQIQVLDSAGVLSGIGANSAAISSQVEIIQSRTLVREVFDKEGYTADPEFAKTRLLYRIFGFILPAKPASESKIFNNFWKRLEVERQGLTYVISVKFESEDRQKAADVVNTIIATYLGSQVDEKSNANAEVSVLLSAQLQGLRDELSQKEATVEQFKEAHNILNVGAGQTLLQSQIQQLSTQLVIAREQARAANNRRMQVASINTNSAPLPALFEYLTDTSSNSLRANYTASSMALSSLQASFGPRHPNIMVAAAELARLENLIRNEVATVLTQINNENALAQTNVTNAETALAALSSQNATSNQDEVELRHLERQAEATRQVLEQLVNRAQETNQLENLQRSDARVISPAVAPITATWPKATLLLAIAAFFGFALGSAIALFMGPKNASQSAQKHPQEVRPNYTDHPQYQPQYATQNQSPPASPNDEEYAQTYAYVQEPIYHSSEPEHQHQFAENSQAPRPTSNYSAGFEEQGNTEDTWARRAAGEPYLAPQSEFGSAQNRMPSQNKRGIPTPRQRLKSNLPQRPADDYQTPIHPERAQQNFAGNANSREGFVTGLKRRLNQNAPR